MLVLRSAVQREPRPLQISGFYRRVKESVYAGVRHFSPDNHPEVLSQDRSTAVLNVSYSLTQSYVQKAVLKL